MPARDRRMDDATLNARFDRLEHEIKAVRGVVDGILDAAGPVPPEHAFKAVVDTVLRERRATFWTTSQKIGLIVFAGIGALDTVLRIFGVGG